MTPGRTAALLLTVAIVLIAAVAGVVALIVLLEGFGTLLDLIARSLEGSTP